MGTLENAGLSPEFPITIKIIGVERCNTLVPTEDSEVPVALSFDPRTAIMKSQWFTARRKCYLEFTKPGISFTVEEVEYVSEKAGAAIRFTVEGVRMDGVKKRSKSGSSLLERVREWWSGKP